MTIALVSQGSIASGGSPSFGTATTSGNLLIAWVGSNGSSASATSATTASGWVRADAGGHAFSWASLWYKPNCGAGETAPVFTDSAGSVFYSQLAEYSGAATASPVDQHGNAYSGTSTPFWAINPPADADAGDLVAVAGFWNGSNGANTISVTRFTDSARTVITQNLGTAANGTGLYFSSLWGITGNTGGNGDYAFMNTGPAFNAGGGAMASFKPASPALFTLTVPAQALPSTWLNFPYPTRTVQATGGTPPYTWSVISGSLPAGLSLSSAGVLSGSSVTAAGTFNFTAQVTDSAARTAAGGLSVTVNGPPDGTSFTSTSSTSATLGPYLATAKMTPASTGFDTYVAANPVGIISVTQTIGAYSPSVFYAATAAGPPSTGQVQIGPCNQQQFVTWNGHGWTHPTGSQNTPLGGLRSLTASYDVTEPEYGTWELMFDLWGGWVGQGGQGTTVASGSNGGVIANIATWASPSAGVLAVTSTSGYPTGGGTLIVQSSSAPMGAFITYTGVSGNTFTGCAYTGGSAGTVSTGGWVYQANSRDIMLWMDTSDERGTGGALLNTPNLTFGIPGQVWDFYYYPQPYPNGPVQGAELIFILQGAGGTGTFGHLTAGTVDILGPLNWLVQQGYDLGNSGSPNYTPRAADPYLNLSMFGWEICNTDSVPGAAATTQTDNFIVNDFRYDYTLNGPAPLTRVTGRRPVTIPVRAGRR